MSRKSTTPDRSRELVEWFKAIGESEPDFAAEEELSGRGYLARALFLRGVVRCVSDRSVEEPSRLEYPGGTEALRRLLEAGADVGDVRTVFRAAQWQSLWQLVCMLDDSSTGIADLQEIIQDVVQWRLFRVGEDGQPLVPLSSLHEDLVDALPIPQAQTETETETETTKRRAAKASGRGKPAGTKARAKR